MTSEADFTPPSAWCPHPQHWHADDEQATEHEVSELVAAFVRALQPELVVETGTNSGCTAEAIGVALARNGHGQLVTIEHAADLAAYAADRCKGLPVTVLHGDSLAWRPPAGQTVDFGWFDSDAHIRHREIEGLLEHFTAGAVVGVHDIGPHHPVHAYLQPLVNAGRLVPIRLRTPRGVTFAQVV